MKKILYRNGRFVWIDNRVVAVWQYQIKLKSCKYLVASAAARIILMLSCQKNIWMIIWNSLLTSNLR